MGILAVVNGGRMVLFVPLPHFEVAQSYAGKIKEPETRVLQETAGFSKDDQDYSLLLNCTPFLSYFSFINQLTDKQHND